MKNSGLKQILLRQKTLNEEGFINIFSLNDHPKAKKDVRSTFFSFKNTNLNTISNEIDNLNFGTNGVFININPLKSNKRTKQYVEKLQNIFIDLDKAEENHKNLVKDFLDKHEIRYSYIAQSGGGYHFLIPIDLSPEKEENIICFLHYLKDKICDKVDVATGDSTRLIRVPESFHNKSTQFQLKTIFEQFPDKEIIESNNENIMKYQKENKKGESDLEYLTSVIREDIFFSSILNNISNFKKYGKYLDKSSDRNNIFIKNLGFFLKTNNSFKKNSLSFLKKWDKSRIKPLEGWIKKSKQENLSVNYKELLKWAYNNDIKEWVLLLKQQLSNSFFDGLEFYYLDDEKQENAYLIYHPELNYYTQKGLVGFLDSIYFHILEKGINLEKEFGLDQLDFWDKISDFKKIKMCKERIYSELVKTKRIQKIFNINYEPSNKKFIYVDNKKYFNIYKSTNLFNMDPSDSTNKFVNIKLLLLNLCGNNKKNYDWFMKWLGWQIQNPLEKLPTAVIFQGQQGTGKGVFKNLILDNIFGNNVQEINQTHLESSFNEYLLGKQIIVANEVIHNENKALLPNVLKNIITDPSITISRKFRTPIETPNYTHWIFCTNNDNPLKIDEGDRRYSVFYSKKLMGGGKAANDFVKKLIYNLDYELINFVNYLKNLTIEEFEVREPIMTEAKQEIIELNKDSIQRFLEYLSQFKNLQECINSFQFRDFEYHIKENYGDEYILTDIFYLSYEAYCKKFSERGVFNKQTFSKKMSNVGVKSNNVYFSSDKKNFRVYKLNDLHNNVIQEIKLLEVKNG